MKKNLNVISLALAGISLLAIGCGAPAPAPVDMAALTATIQGMEDAYAAASVNKDAAAVVAYYADDVVGYNNEEAPTVGKEAVRQRLADRMAKDTLGLVPTFKVLEIFAGGDYLTEIGSFSNADAAGVVKDHGTYFSVFKKTGDTWLCMRDISVSHMPKAEAATAMAAQ